MGFEFNDGSVTFTETGSKLNAILSGIALIIVGLALLYLRQFAEVDTKGYRYLTFGGFVGPLVGIGAIVYGFLCKEKIYDIYPDRIDVSLKKSEEIIEEIPKSEIRIVQKEIIYRKQNPQSPAILSNINYSFHHEYGVFTLDASDNVVDSERFDNFVHSQLEKQIQVKERLIQPTN